MTVLMRPPRPTSRAIRLASTDHTVRSLSITCCWTSRGRWSHTSSAGYGALSRSGRTRARGAEDVDALEQAELVAGHEVGVLDEVRGADRVGAEPQVRHGDGAGLLGVVDEVALGPEVGVVADDLDALLVRADGAVAAEAVEDGAARARRDREVGIARQREAGDVVDDADGEAALRRGGGELGEDGRDVLRGELLRAEAVPAADDGGASGRPPGGRGPRRGAAAPRVRPAP